MIYLIGSLRNPEVPNIANKLRAEGFEVFDDWYSAGPEADDKWRDYETGRGHSYSEGLSGYTARHVFSFDFQHLNRSSEVVLVLPAGKSGHLELGYAIGRGKRGYILLNDPDRWDVMYQFATKVTIDLNEIINDIRLLPNTNSGTWSQVGPEIPRPSTTSVFVVERPEHPNWCRHSEPFKECCECWLQWISSRND